VLFDAMETAFIRDFGRTSPADGDALMRWLFEGAVERVARQAEALRLDVTRLATTLSVAVVDRDRAVFGQIGDGIIASECGDEIKTLLVEEKDDYANATWFIQSDGAFEQAFRTTSQVGVTAFALSTDGMSYKITNVASGEPYEPFFRGSWQHVRTGVNSANFTALLRGIEDDQTGDDKTMVLAARRWEEDQFFPSPRPDRRVQVSSPVPPPIPAEPEWTAPPEPETDPLVAEGAAKRRFFRRRDR
jgi:hypothetical protein